MGWGCVPSAMVRGQVLGAPLPAVMAEALAPGWLDGGGGLLELTAAVGSERPMLPPGRIPSQAADPDVGLTAPEQELAA